MTIDKINVVLAEMERLKERANALKKVLKEENAYETYNTDIYIRGRGREVGAVRRASMDLTRALADLRR